MGRRYRQKEYSDLREQYDASFHTATNLEQTASAAGNCSEFFLTSLLPQLREVTVTSPEAARQALRRYRLDGLSSARAELGVLLTEPVSVADFVNDMATCTAQSAPLAAWGCELMAQGTTTPQVGGSYIVGLDATTYFVTQMMVLDKLTTAAVTSSTFADAMRTTALRAVERAGGANALIDNDPSIIDHKQFFKDKYASIRAGIYTVNRHRRVVDGLVAMSPQTFAARSRGNAMAMHINVMEAVATEWDAGLKDNAYYGIAVAHYTSNRGDQYTVVGNQPGGAPGTMDRQLKWNLGKEWVDSYVAW